MKLDVLVACMHRSDNSLIAQSRITGNALVINQCDREGEYSFQTERGTVRWVDSRQRGLTRSRNMAIANARGDICLICDDDETFVPNYEEKSHQAYDQLPQADIVILKMVDRTPSFPDRVMRLRFPLTMKVSSCQISFRRERLLAAGIRFDMLLGAGSGNGAAQRLHLAVQISETIVLAAVCLNLAAAAAVRAADRPGGFWLR